MHAGRCLNCQAELPEAGRFCVMCGKRVGHSMRDRSSDRRVYTSAVGHSVPPEVIIEIQKNERSGEMPSQRSSDIPQEEDPEERRHLTSRVTRRKSDAALSELWQSLLWAALLSTLGALVAWGVYAALRRSTPVPIAQPEPPRPLPVARVVKPSSPPVKPAPSHDLVIPVPVAANSMQAPAPAPMGVAPPSVPSGVSLPGREMTAASAQNNDIDFVASQHSPQVRACYDRAFRNAGDKAPAGRVELSFFLIERDGVGRAAEVKTELNLLGEPQVAGCLEELVGEWRFPRPPSSAAVAGPTRLRYPFVFTPAPLQ